MSQGDREGTSIVTSTRRVIPTHPQRCQELWNPFDFFGEKESEHDPSIEKQAKNEFLERSNPITQVIPRIFKHRQNRYIAYSVHSAAVQGLGQSSPFPRGRRFETSYVGDFFWICCTFGYPAHHQIQINPIFPVFRWPATHLPSLHFCHPSRFLQPFHHPILC